VLFYSATNNPLKWRHRAEEARAMAEEFSDGSRKETMLKIATAYDEMAVRAEGQCKPRALEKV
jgi:hypothetical protein